MVAASLAAVATKAQAWGHQQHILITRMAALRIINDPAVPEGLKDFLKANMKYDLDACRKLAVGEKVGFEAKDYLTGLDGACTLPDRIQFTEEGKTIIASYGVTESKMHFMDWESLGKRPMYKPDFSNRPEIADVPRDVHDPRWKQAGYLPFRVEEKYNELVAAFAAPKLDNAQTLKIAGYLCHYIEDCTQPLHGTVDYKSYSYLFGKVPAVHKLTQTLPDGSEIAKYTVDKEFSKSINPHDDMEFQLFEDAQEPRKGLREEFWKELNLRIDWRVHSATTVTPVAPAKAGTFTRALEILWDSYEYIPAIGKAAQAGYATGQLDLKAFFTSKDTVHGEELDTLQLIADRHAAAVLEVERTLRAAWAEAKGK